MTNKIIKNKNLTDQKFSKCNYSHFKTENKISFKKKEFKSLKRQFSSLKPYKIKEKKMYFNSFRNNLLKLFGKEIKISR